MPFTARMCQTPVGHAVTLTTLFRHAVDECPWRLLSSSWAPRRQLIDHRSCRCNTTPNNQRRPKRLFASGRQHNRFDDDNDNDDDDDATIITEFSQRDTFRRALSRRCDRRAEFSSAFTFHGIEAHPTSLLRVKTVDCHPQGRNQTNLVTSNKSNARPVLQRDTIAFTERVRVIFFERKERGTTL